MPPIIVWFRQDLRLADNPALSAVPELEGCDTRLIHRPWGSSDAAVRAYVKPIVEHERARARALDAFKSISS